MKLTVDFSALWQNVSRISADIADIDLHSDLAELGDDLFDDELSTVEGVDVDLSELDSHQGVLSVKGRQVILFIPDQGVKIESVLSGDSEGSKFHVAECSTLIKMRDMNRFDRYKVTNNLDGQFGVYGHSSYSGRHLEGIAELKVCKNCLTYLNYQGYRSGQNKAKIYDNFDIPEFLGTYSTLFRGLPKQRNYIDLGGYSEDWEETSKRYRAKNNWVCESCHVCLTDSKKLLHTHHINGNKRDNSEVNLQSLCLDCHRKQPLHDHMHIRHSDMQRINQLRGQQGLLSFNTWDEVIAVADQALEGILRKYASKRHTIPVVGYDVRNHQGETVATLEIAWPAKKKGIAISTRDINAAQEAGWKVLSIGEAIRMI